MCDEGLGADTVLTLICLRASPIGTVFLTKFTKSTHLHVLKFLHRISRFLTLPHAGMYM
jgi:hypothetical protein